MGLSQLTWICSQGKWRFSLYYHLWEWEWGCIPYCNSMLVSSWSIWLQWRICSFYLVGIWFLDIMIWTRCANFSCSFGHFGGIVICLSGGIDPLHYFQQIVILIVWFSLSDWNGARMVNVAPISTVAANVDIK